MDAISNKERKKLTKMVQHMDSMRGHNMIGSNKVDIVNGLYSVLASLTGVNNYISAYDDHYVGLIEDAGVVSFGWPLSMKAFDKGFRWFVPLEWNGTSKKNNLYKWAYWKVYQASNEVFTRRLPDFASEEYLRAAFEYKSDSDFKKHHWSTKETDFRGEPIVLIYRDSSENLAKNNEK